MRSDTSWESSASWYDKAVGEKGHLYHQTVVIPKLLALLQLRAGCRLLDLACGQGVVARALPAQIGYIGIDISPSLVREAKRRSSHQFLVGDVSQPLKVAKDFTHACVVLALQNIEAPDTVVKNIAAHLLPEGRAVIVLNHPCFRIPRQSSWGIDEPKKLQYRRIDRYLSPLKIPIQTHPSQKEASTVTWSFHKSLSEYSLCFKESGFVIDSIEEWVSDRQSTGKNGRMENFARAEFPLFLAFSLLKSA